MKAITLLLVAVTITTSLLTAQPPTAFAERPSKTMTDAPQTEVHLTPDQGLALLQHFEPLRTPYRVAHTDFNPLVSRDFRALDVSYYTAIPAMSKYLTTPDQVQFWAVGYRKTEQATLALVYALQYKGAKVPTEYWVQALKEEKEGFRRMGAPVLLARYISSDVTESGTLDAKLGIKHQWQMRNPAGRDRFITHEEKLVFVG